MPFLFPLIIGGAGMLGLGATAGVTVSKGADKIADALKWTVLGGLGVAAILGTIYVLKKA